MYNKLKEEQQALQVNEEEITVYNKLKEEQQALQVNEEEIKVILILYY